MSREVPEIEFHSRAEWRAWLQANHASSGGIWLVAYKKHHPDYLDYEHQVEEALCFGWIDGTRRRVDDDRSMMYFSPRRPGSNWAGTNKRRVAQLERAGLMAEAGRAKVREAKQNGSWTVLDDIEALVVPDDLAVALAGVPEAASNFEAYPRSAKMGFLWWVKSAKTAATREKRISGTVRAAQQGIRVPGGA
ncbi:MAG: hypothetical protein GEU80_02970 [Dehalococcoidia bacterium]|nr:hypothetical protein [Dehalococcoidia bacterium]